jgi:hypothetical protein
MHKLPSIARLFFGALVLAAIAHAPLSPTVAHEGHDVQCNETGMNAMHADMQAMRDGDAKTKAMKEMDVAMEMMAKGDMDACMTHMHNAMEIMEE